MKTIALKIIFSVLVVSSIISAQNITNTLGTNGSFKIKDGTTDYLNLDQTTGNISLLRNIEIGGVINSTSTRGVITKNGQRFIHNYQMFKITSFSFLLTSIKASPTISFTTPCCHIILLKLELPAPLICSNCAFIKGSSTL